MSALFMDLETLRPDIYLSEEQKRKMREQVRPPDKISVVRGADTPLLVSLLREIASQYKHEFGDVPKRYAGTSEPTVRNIQGVDVDDLHDLLCAVADNIEEREKKGRDFNPGLDSIEVIPMKTWNGLTVMLRMPVIDDLGQTKEFHRLVSFRATEDGNGNTEYTKLMECE